MKASVCSSCGASDHRCNNKECPQYETYITSRKSKAVSIHDILPSDSEYVEEEPEVLAFLGTDTYTEDVLIEQYTIHKTYILSRIASGKTLGIKFRLPAIPEDISENLIKFTIHKLGDTTSSWRCKGDLVSKKEGVQECKAFTSDGPLSYSPSSDWDVIYFLDARLWLQNIFVLYKIKLKKSSEEWGSIKVSKTQTFSDQAKQGRRPRIGWKLLYPQLSNHIEKVYEGTFEGIFRAPQSIDSQ